MTRWDEGVFHGAPGLKLYYQRWRPDGPARAVLAVIQDPGPLGELYPRAVNSLPAQGYALYCFEHRELKHGPGDPEYAADWEEILADVGAFVGLVHAAEPEIPLFLTGNAAGAYLALAYALHRPEDIQGVIALGPTALAPVRGPLPARLARNLSGIWPREWMSPAPAAGTILDETPTEQSQYADLPVPHVIVPATPEDRDRVLDELVAWLEGQL